MTMTKEEKATIYIYVYDIDFFFQPKRELASSLSLRMDVFGLLLIHVLFFLSFVFSSSHLDLI